MELPIFNTYMNFLTIIFVASQLFLCLFWISLMAWNRCLQHPCFENLCKIAQASKNSDSNAQHFLWDLLTHSWFHSMLCALPGYQFPYIVMNRCLYLMMSQPMGHSDVYCLTLLNKGLLYWMWIFGVCSPPFWMHIVQRRHHNSKRPEGLEKISRMEWTILVNRW